MINPERSFATDQYPKFKDELELSSDVDFLATLTDCSSESPSCKSPSRSHPRSHVPRPSARGPLSVPEVDARADQAARVHQDAKAHHRQAPLGCPTSLKSCWPTSSLRPRRRREEARPW